MSEQSAVLTPEEVAAIEARALEEFPVSMSEKVGGETRYDYNENEREIWIAGATEWAEKMLRRWDSRAPTKRPENT